MEKELLLSSSLIFSNSNIFDRIRQSYIDLHGECEVDYVKDLLNDAISYLDKDITIDLASELFSLIHACFSRFPVQLLPIFDSLLQKARFNSYRIIITASVLSYLTHVQPSLLIPDFSPFVNDALKEIVPQIQNVNNNIKKSITVFNQTIAFRFETDLILDLLLSTKITKELIIDFSPYINSKPNIYKNPKFSTFINDRLTKSSYSEHSIDDFGIFIPFLSDQLFIQIYPQIEKAFCESTHLSSNFIINLLEKCVKVGKKLKSIEKVFSFLSISEFTPKICELLKKQDFSINNKILIKFKEMSDTELLYKICSKVTNLPTDLLYRFLVNQIDLRNSDSSFSKPDLYIQIYSYFNDKKNNCSSKLMKIIAILFNKFVSTNETSFNEIIDNIIFSYYPPTHHGVTFLKQFLNSLDEKFQNLFNSPDHMNDFLLKILDKKIIPIYSFFEIIENESVFKLLEIPNYTSNPLLLYAYYFTKPKNSNKKELTEITIIEQNEQSNSILVDFINNNEFDLLVNLNEESLSLVSCALIFSNCQENLIVNGLNKENIIQFFAIAQNNYDYYSSSSNDFPEMLALLIDGIEYICNNQLPSILASINSILNSDSSLLSDDIKSQITDYLTKFLLNDQYYGDKTILFSNIAQNNKILDESFYEIFDYFTKHLNEIDCKSIKSKMSYDDFTLRLNENDSLSVLNSVYFISNFCNDVPSEIENPSILIRVFHEQINENKLDDVLMIANFMVKCNLSSDLYKIIKEENIPISFKNQLLQIVPPSELNIDEIISVFLLNLCPEENKELAKELFNKLIKEKSNLLGFLIIQIEKIHNELILSPKYILKHFSKYINIDEDAFIESLNHLYILNPEENIFVRRSETLSFNPSESEFNQNIILKLYNEINEKENYYQAFFCLNCIASYFPFFFDSNPQKVFDIVFPQLNYFSLLFDDILSDEEQEKIRVEKVKTAISALSFLISALNSNKMMDSFLLWSFNAFKTFSDSQNLCFILILIFISSESAIKTILASLLMKNTHYFYMLRYFSRLN